MYDISSGTLLNGERGLSSPLALEEAGEEADIETVGLGKADMISRICLASFQSQSAVKSKLSDVEVPSSSCPSGSRSELLAVLKIEESTDKRRERESGLMVVSSSSASASASSEDEHMSGERDIPLVMLLLTKVSMLACLDRGRAISRQCMHEPDCCWWSWTKLLGTDLVNRLTGEGVEALMNSPTAPEGPLSCETLAGDNIVVVSYDMSPTELNADADAGKVYFANWARKLESSS